MMSHDPGVSSYCNNHTSQNGERQTCQHTCSRLSSLRGANNGVVADSLTLVLVPLCAVAKPVSFWKTELG